MGGQISLARLALQYTCQSGYSICPRDHAGPVRFTVVPRFRALDLGVSCGFAEAPGCVAYCTSGCHDGLTGQRAARQN